MRAALLAGAALAVVACSSGGSGGDVAVTCDRLAAIGEPAAVFDELDPTRAGAARAALDGAAAEIGAAAADAPSDVRSALDTIRTAIEDQVAALDPGGVPSDPDALDARFAAVAAAEADVSAWRSEHCG